MSTELSKHNASKLEEKLRLPAYGNYVDHDKLFSGEYKDLRGFTRDRRWLISEFIFNAKINRLIDHQGLRTIDGQRMSVIGDNGVNLGTRFGGGTLRQSITNPFLLPTNIGVPSLAVPKRNRSAPRLNATGASRTPLIRGHMVLYSVAKRTVSSIVRSP